MPSRPHHSSAAAGDTTAPGDRSHPPPGRGSGRSQGGWAAPRGALAALVAADVAFAYQQTAVLPVVPAVERALHASGAWGAWLVSGYLLVATVSTPLIGRLADLYGRRRLLVVGLAVFLLGSIGAAVSPNFPTLVAFRALQGIGGAVFPLSLSVARQEVPREQVGKATGLLTGAFGMGTALGFATSGALASVLSWRAVFVVGAAVVAVAIPLVLRYVPAREPLSSGETDLLGAVLLGVALGALLIALTVAPQSHGAQWLVPAGLLVLAVSGALAWLRREHATPDPLIGLRLLRSPTQLWTNGITLALGYGLFGAYYLVPQFVQDGKEGFGADTALIGLYLLPSAVGQLAGGPAADWLGRGASARRPLGIGLAAMGVAMVGFATGGLTGNSAGFLVASFVMGCGAGLAISASSTVVTLGAGAENASVATALNSTARRVGGGIGSQISASVLIFVGRGAVGWATAFAIAAGLSLLAAPCCARLPGTEALRGGEPADQSW